MNKQQALTVIAWDRRRNAGIVMELTLYRYFAAAFEKHVHKLDQHSHEQIDADCNRFELYGEVPMYVARFLGGLCATFVVPATNPKRRQRWDSETRW